MMKLCFATNNPNKIKEVKQLLGNKVELLSLADIGCTEELAEDSDTIQGNAHQKAAYINNNYRVNCFADDTGLEVEALNNEPGVYSARYAGPQRSNEDNMDLILYKLQGQANRKAQFKTVISAYVNQKEYIFEGIASGQIINEKIGLQGFGYDPIFKPEGFDKTFAEMELQQKNEISHRAKAIHKFVEFLNNNFLKSN